MRSWPLFLVGVLCWAMFTVFVFRQPLEQSSFVDFDTESDRDIPLFILNVCMYTWPLLIFVSVLCY